MPTISKQKTGRKATHKDSRKAGKVLNEKKNVEKKPVKKKTKPFLERLTFAVDLILQQKFTDGEITAKVDVKFPNYPGSPVKFNQKEMGRARWMIRNDKLTARQFEKDQPFGRLFKNEAGELVERSELPKKARTAKKIKKENDPLNNIAGVNVHDKEEKEKKKPAAKKTKVSKAEALKNKIKKSKQKK